MKHLGSFNTIEAFWQFASHLAMPSKLRPNHTYHLFKCTIKPLWEDEANREGGKLSFEIPSDHKKIDEIWLEFLMALVGETLEEDRSHICGLVFSHRSKTEKVSLWIKAIHDPEAVRMISERMKAILESFALNPTITYAKHKADKKPKSARFPS